MSLYLSTSLQQPPLYYSLHLINFGCHDDLTLEFSNQQRRVNIAGQSGCGKSTVLEAILFVLTEHHAVKYLPWNNKKAVVVSLSCFGDDDKLLWSIKRGRRPNVLEVVDHQGARTDADHQGARTSVRTYQKELAEAWINRKFGSNLLLNSVCLFSQLDGWSLLTATSKRDKSSLLEEVLTDDTRAVYEQRLTALSQLPHPRHAILRSRSIHGTVCCINLREPATNGLQSGFLPEGKFRSLDREL